MNRLQDENGLNTTPTWIRNICNRN